MNATTSVGTFELRFAHRPLLPDREPIHLQSSLGNVHQQNAVFPRAAGAAYESGILNHNC